MNRSERMSLTGTVGIRLKEQGEVMRLQSEKQQLMSRILSLERNFQILTKGTALGLSLADLKDTGIGFSASMNRHNFMKSQETLVFDEILANTGNAYDPACGVFRAPVSGRYMFSLTIRAQFHKQVSAEIVGDDGKVFGRVTAGYGAIDRASASVTIITELPEESAIFVRQVLDRTGEYYGKGNTVFTGLLLE